jgi:hypothetical protein
VIYHQKTKMSQFCPIPEKTPATTGNNSATKKVVLPTVLQFRNQGDTLPVIADKLNKMGVKTRRGGKWYASTVTNILKRA